MFNTRTIFVHAINLLPPIVGWEQVCVLWTLLCKPETSPGRTRELWVSHTLVSPCSPLFFPSLLSSILPSPFSFLPSSLPLSLTISSLLHPSHFFPPTLSPGKWVRTFRGTWRHWKWRQNRVFNPSSLLPCRGSQSCLCWWKRFRNGHQMAIQVVNAWSPVTEQ